MSVSAALVDALTEDDLRTLALRLQPFLAELAVDAARDGRGQWLNTGDAAAYLGLSVNALHKLTARREIPFEQDGPGCKLWFQRGELDRWRRGETRPRPIGRFQTVSKGAKK